ncbi:MAG: helix-turn-helix transcriptional regulator [Thermoplasmata archaeon]|nr:helix-turn-helix transcriptional regulator [Thermoplasmata archaeon]
MSELFALLGQPHMLRILSALNESDSDSLRFTELQVRLQMSPKTLSLRLRTLVEGGFVTRHAFREIPPRVEYQPTAKLVELSTLFGLLREWATENTMHATPILSVIGRHPSRTTRATD